MQKTSDSHEFYLFDKRVSYFSLFLHEISKHWQSWSYKAQIRIPGLNLLPLLHLADQLNQNNQLEQSSFRVKVTSLSAFMLPPSKLQIYLRPCDSGGKWVLKFGRFGAVCCP